MNNNKTTQTIDELWPSPWLKAEHLPAKGAIVKISDATLEQLRPKGQLETKLVLAFEKATRKLICNKTQAYAMAEIAGTRNFREWIGVTVKLTTGRAHNGKPTVIVSPAPATEVH